MLPCGAACKHGHHGHGRDQPYVGKQVKAYLWRCVRVAAGRETPPWMDCKAVVKLPLCYACTTRGARAHALAGSKAVRLKWWSVQLELCRTWVPAAIARRLGVRVTAACVDELAGRRHCEATARRGRRDGGRDECVLMCSGHSGLCVRACAIQGQGTVLVQVIGRVSAHAPARAAGRRRRGSMDGAGRLIGASSWPVRALRWCGDTAARRWGR